MTNETREKLQQQLQDATEYADKSVSILCETICDQVNHRDWLLTRQLINHAESINSSAMMLKAYSFQPK